MSSKHAVHFPYELQTFVAIQIYIISRFYAPLHWMWAMNNKTLLKHKKAISHNAEMFNPLYFIPPIPCETLVIEREFGCFFHKQIPMNNALKMEMKKVKIGRWTDERRSEKQPTEQLLLVSTSPFIVLEWFFFFFFTYGSWRSPRRQGREYKRVWGDAVNQSRTRYSYKVNGFINGFMYL